MTIRFKRNREIGKPLTVKFAIRTYDASVDCRNFPIDCRNYNLGDRFNDACHENAAVYYQRTINVLGFNCTL